MRPNFSSNYFGFLLSPSVHSLDNLSPLLHTNFQQIITAAPCVPPFVCIQCKEGNVLIPSSDRPLCASRRNELRRNIKAFLLQKYSCTGTNTGSNYLWAAATISWINKISLHSNQSNLPNVNQHFRSNTVSELLIENFL